MEPEKSIQGPGDQMAETVEAWRGIGVDHLLLDVVAGGGPDGRLEALVAFMTGVAPDFS